MGETFLFSHYHNPLLPFTTKLWSVSVLPYLLFILQSYWTQFSAFIMPQKLFQQRLPKPPKYQTQWAFHGILMWPLYSNLTLVAHSFLHLFFLLVLLPLLFGSFTSSFFHQLLEYPPGMVASWCSSLLTVPLLSTCGGLLIPAPSSELHTSVFSQHFQLTFHVRLKFICTQSHTPALPHFVKEPLSV